MAKPPYPSSRKPGAMDLKPLKKSGGIG